MNKIVSYVIFDLIRNKTIILYTLILFGLACTVFSMEDNYEKGLVSLLNIVLFVVPLVSIVFSSIYLYNSAEFINLLVSQPIRRTQIWKNLFLGLITSTTLAFFIAVGIPTFIFAFSISGLILVGCGMILTIIFVALAMLIAVQIRDKSKGIGLAILLWLYFALFFDSLILFFLFQFSDYPIEQFMVAVSMLNPIDLSRILILLQIDLSAMLGYTGAIFREFFGNLTGMSITLSVLIMWWLVPYWLSIKKFKNKDL